MTDREKEKVMQGIHEPGVDEELYQQCLQNAEGDEEMAKTIYSHRRRAELELAGSEDPDAREKWPMLAPLLILYALGTIGVLLLVFGFLGIRLNWW